MSEICKKRVVLALGHFDSVHIGHREVIGLAKEKAVSLGVLPAVFLFDGDLKSVIGKTSNKPVYSLNKRIDLIKNLGVDEFYFAPISKDFLSLTKNEFLDKLNDEYDILSYVSGDDYRFGKNAEGDVKFLKEYAKSKGQTVYTADTKTFDGIKISTSLIKEKLLLGDVKKANLLLGENYSVTGVVYRDRKVGTKIGFPTVNLKIDSDLIALKQGVYKGEIILHNKPYKTIINYGTRPTFDNDLSVIEAHIIGFSGDLYDKEITLYFTDYLRDIKKFSSEDELKNQLKSDIERTKEND